MSIRGILFLSCLTDSCLRVLCRQASPDPLPRPQDLFWSSRVQRGAVVGRVKIFLNDKKKALKSGFLFRVALVQSQLGWLLLRLGRGWDLRGDRGWCGGTGMGHGRAGDSVARRAGIARSSPSERSSASGTSGTQAGRSSARVPGLREEGERLLRLVLRRKWAGGCRAAGLWSWVGVFTNAGCQARGIVNQSLSRIPGVGSRGKATGKRKSSIRLDPWSGPCLSQISLPSPAVSCARVFGGFHIVPRRRLGALTHCLPPVLAPAPSTLGGDRESRTMTSPLPSPCKFRVPCSFRCAGTFSHSRILPGHLFCAGRRSPQEAGRGGGRTWLILGRGLVHLRG